MASITGWTRLEPRPRSAEFDISLEARLRDPLWMLARQWQVGEFKGDDAGSLVAARLEMDVAPVNRFQPGPEAQAQPYDLRDMPLETLVERESVLPPQDIDLRLAAEAGLHFMRLLRQAGGESLEARYRETYLTGYPLPELDDPGAGGARFLAVMRGRAPDGVALEADLRPGLQSDPPALPPTPAIDPGDEAGVLQAGRAWLAWWDSMFSQPRSGTQAWVPEKLEYQFRVSAPAGAGPEAAGEVVLAAQEYYSGELDWFAFDLQTDASLGGDAGPGAMESRVQTVVPTGVDFEGMPAPRWWEFEDGRVDFGRVDAAPEDLARLLLLEFALVYGNDWLMIPVSLEVGSLCRIRSLVVSDTFGERVAIPASAQPADPEASWGLYYLAESGRPLTHRTAAAEQVFFLPPTLASSLESTPLEEVLLVRDEMANMAWAIERKVQGADGRPVDRFEAYQEKLRRLPPPAQDPVEEAEAVYQLASTVPDHWIPLLPVQIGEGQRAIALQRGAMLDPETGEGILARGRLLTPGSRLIIEDEEVPRVGVRAMRHFQHTRWTNGAALLWMGRRKQPGRGEGSSGLRFDMV
jgi:hypothetical protein